MEIFKTAAELQKFALDAKRSGKIIGLVPTMGYLHAGHASLIDIARKKADIVIVSIFVNPTQFGPTEDLDKYPRDFEHDLELCTQHGADVIYAPAPDAMYEADASTWVEEVKLSKVLCGVSRPIHFRGVTTVVAKLFNLTLPDIAVFGEKDAQQLLVIKRMVRDLNFPVEIIAAPLVRQNDGLALSSRNRYLSETEKSNALVLSQSLYAARGAIESHGLEGVDLIIEAMKEKITAAGGRVDYVEALDTANLEPPTAETKEVLLALAVFFGTTRLIDNQIIQVK
ncbi:MAG: pantoate--beta-alanine ligase [Lentisphaeria bacterium]|jgi:pantoate--beta-alanine ligase|nr:pantoate--beta-alanine ligase [Lentisphaeria bacterium]